MENENESVNQNTGSEQTAPQPTPSGHPDLGKYDFAILIDKSGSMTNTDCPGGKTRWAFAQEIAESIARECEKHDDDGIDVIVFAGKPTEYNNVTAAKVAQIFNENSPNGSTDTAAALQVAFDAYNTRKKAGSVKPLIIVCITDGEPTDQGAVDRAIINHANSLNEDGDTGITFVQIGGDAGARAFLKHLDDDLQGLGAKFDIVDTKNNDELESMSIIDLLTEAITD